MPSLSATFNAGNAGASALVKSAASLASAQNDYEDKVMALQWSQSSKTQDDWDRYAGYLDGRISSMSGSGTLTGASKALTLTSTQDTASKAFVSSEIQRQSIGIMEGNATLQDKANAVASFYEMAANSGDDNLAQSLRSQYDSIDQQIQYQAQQQQSLNEQMVSKNVTSIGALMATYKQDLTQFSQQFSQFGAKHLDSLSKQYADNLKSSGVDVGGRTPGIWDIASGVVNQMLTTLQQAIAVYGPVDGAALVSQYNDIVSGQTHFNVGGASLTYDDINKGQMAAAAGQEYYRVVDDGGTTKLVANKEQAYVWGKTTTGQYALINTYTPQGADFGNTGTYNKDANGNYLDVSSGAVVAKTDKNGNVVDSKGRVFSNQAQMQAAVNKSQYNYTQLLENAGFNVRSSNGQTYITGTDQTSSFFKQNGLEPDEEVRVLPGTNGELRFLAPPDQNGNINMYGLSFKGNGQFSSLFQINPLTDTQPGFAGSLSASKLTAAGELKQNQLKPIAQLNQVTPQPVASLPKINLPTPPVLQPASTAGVVQPAAPSTTLQNAAPGKPIQNASNPQPASSVNLNQSGSSSGIKLSQPKIQTIPL